MAGILAGDPQERESPGTVLNGEYSENKADVKASMRILHILDHSIPLQSGYSFRTRAILEQQRALGWETFQVTSPKHHGAREPLEKVDGFEFFRSAPLTGTTVRLPVVNQLAVISGLSRRIEEVVDRTQPEILHAHSPALNGMAALRVARRRDLPLVYEVRAFWEDAAVDHGTSREGGIRYRLSRALETHVMERADAVTTICGGLRDEIIARGIPAHKVTVIPNAVDPGQFAFDSARDPDLARSLGLADKRVLGFIGSFYVYEGLALLLEALPVVLEADAGVVLLLVGGGPEEQRLQALARRLRLGDKVAFAGRVPHGEVARYYGLVDIFVYPRLPMRLTELVTPLKPLEAMARGKLVLASDVGGHRELIRQGETGELFRAGDRDALARAITALLAQDADWPRRRAAARRFVESERSWAASVARYAPVYGELCHGRARA